MGKLKEFWNQNKEVVIASSIVVGSIAIGVFLSRSAKIRADKMTNIQLRSLVWAPVEGPSKYFNLEEVKTVLDANAENNSLYAIFREGISPDKYEIINLAGEFVKPF